MSNQNQLNLLLSRLELLLKKQEDFSKEVNALKTEILQLRASQTKEHPANLEVEDTSKEKVSVKETSIKTNKFRRNLSHKVLGGVCAGIADYLGIHRIIIRILFLIFSVFFGIGFLLYIILWIFIPSENRSIINLPLKEPHKSKTIPSSDLEKFIGENLINKIGIIIIIIGVAIGAKYSIEHNLISPLTRIILGYLVGVGLLGFGIKLKTSYENFSAVLVSGAISIMYFMTYAAYSFYMLFPQVVAFVFMVVFTIFSVIAALHYNKQVIAHIGLVGAYAVPFLLSEESGNATILFSYMVIINGGILVIAIKKYWKPLYLSSFVITWLIYASWQLYSYSSGVYFGVALTFIIIFFTIFYAAFLVFKLIKKEQFQITDILMLLANSFVFYGFGYGILESHEVGSQLLGVFTLCNGIVHFIVSVIIYKQKLGDKNLFYLVSGLVLVFITITIPVQLDGNWVTLLWVGEGALLFWIGRTKGLPVYEYIAYPLMILAVFSIFQDWSVDYHQNYYKDMVVKINPILNIHFLTSVLFIVAFGFIFNLNRNEKYASPVRSDLYKMISYLIPAVLLVVLYYALRLEIENYWFNRYHDSKLEIGNQVTQANYDLRKFRVLWVLNYSLFFVSALAFLNINKIKSKLLGHINLLLLAFTVLLFLFQGLYVISELRDSYLNQVLGDYYNIGVYNIVIRYTSLLFLGLGLFACYKYIRTDFIKIQLNAAFDMLLFICILWVASSELIHWLDMADFKESYKLGLSILWGVYALFLIALGIWKSKKYLRIGAIVIFAITLLKLFFYDISHLNTLSKTIVFLSLGVLLLIISFLYNKFKHKITDDIKN
ncbi:DUF2339 domain-containing protein [Gaetbulibacter saemankumensis]|uniref:DUF2339 domain-containing protein n=1 Tax=Gaetbulibacter saemankumensis TaxID=311208 RepID=UPI000480B88D|nr:DUF2339 domain-containing protein [Gaetbulibacter saemankumensis]